MFYWGGGGVYAYMCLDCYACCLPVSSQELTTVSEEKPQLKCIHEHSIHLLYLEPIFDGSHVREDLKGLTEKFQQLTLKIFSLLEEQVS